MAAKPFTMFGATAVGTVYHLTDTCFYDAAVTVWQDDPWTCYDLTFIVGEGGEPQHRYTTSEDDLCNFLAGVPEERIGNEEWEEGDDE